MTSLHKDALTCFPYTDPKYHSGKEIQDSCNTKFFQGSFPPWRWSRNRWRLVALRNSVSRGTMVTVSVVAPWHVCLSLKFLPRHYSLNFFLWYLSNTGHNGYFGWEQKSRASVCKHLVQSHPTGLTPLQVPHPSSAFNNTHEKFYLQVIVVTSSSCSIIQVRVAL